MKEMTFASISSPATTSKKNRGFRDSFTKGRPEGTGALNRAYVEYRILFIQVNSAINKPTSTHRTPAAAGNVIACNPKEYDIIR